MPGYVPSEAPVRTVGAAGPAGNPQFFIAGEDLPRGWWHWFGSDAIVGLVEQAFAGNPGIAAAQARLRRAEAQWRANNSGRFPELAAEGSLSYSEGDSRMGTGSRSPAGPGDGGGGGESQDGSGFTVYTGGASVSYNLDLAGGRTRAIQAALAEVERQEQLLQGAYVAMVGNIVSAALDSAALRAQINAREELLASQAERINLLTVRVEEGADARADLITEIADLAALRATIPPLRARLAASNHRLALLVGEEPAVSEIPLVRLGDLRLPETVPIALPSSLVRTRPDILAAEALLARTSAEIGVEAADLYPSVTIDAGFGLTGVAGGLALASPGSFLNAGAGLFAPLFDGGRRRAERDAAVASYEEALALYREQVLAAFGEVADGIRALENDAAALADRRVALDAAAESLALAQFQLSEGAISVIDALTIRQRYEEARFAYIDAISNRFQDTAALFAALGPGPLDQEQLAGIAASDHLDATRALLEAGIVPDGGS